MSTTWTASPGRLFLQVLNYAVFMAIVWYFSSHPVYSHIGKDQAVLSMAFSHAGKLVSECVSRTREELEQLAPNMRTDFDCPRERSPIALELRLDNELVASMRLEAPGLYNDQDVNVYHELVTTAGTHELSIWMNDDVNVAGPTHEYRRMVAFAPAQRVVLSFDPATGKFVLR